MTEFISEPKVPEFVKIRFTCDHCRWWSRLEETETGRCYLYENDNLPPDFPRLAIKVPGDQAAILDTEANFGCIQWEGKK